MSAPLRPKIHLAPDERFELWGKTVTHIRIERPATDESQAALYGRDGYIGTLAVSASAELSNILEARKAWAR